MSAIEWTDATWNPVTGCDRVSPGCANCYALDLAARLKGMGQAKYQRDGDPRTSGPGFGVTLHPGTLDQPLRWRKPRMVFVNSMSDLFHEQVHGDYVMEVLDVIERCPQHTFQVLTKRPERMREHMSCAVTCEGCLDNGWLMGEVGCGEGCPDCDAEPGESVMRIRDRRARERWPNLWLGVSIENRRFVHRADVLRETPAAVRFISAEPLLGPLVHDSATSGTGPSGYSTCWRDAYSGSQLDLTGIDWLIAGGESGPKHRRIDIDWVRNLRDAAAWNGTAFFLKQWGGRTPKAGGRELDGRAWDEMPATAVAETEGIAS